MKLTSLSVENYKGLRDVTIPLSRFGCLIGENNSGKSSFLQALALFFSGSKVFPIHFFDPAKTIRIAVTLDDITPADLSRLEAEDRSLISGIIDNGRLVVVRAWGSEGKSSLLYSKLTPIDPRFLAENINTLVKSQRAGQAFVDKVVAIFPELSGKIDATMNQDAVRQKIRELADSLPAGQKKATDQGLPTGVDKSVLKILPEPIYIPAVKDLADDIKTTESTPFGKILSILLQAVEAKLPDAQQLFKDLNSKLNRIVDPDGTFADGRLDEVKLIESTVEKYVRESFSEVAVRLAIPPPELKTVFSSAQIYANDGVEGIIDSKGDGLRRAIVFSILRSYVELKASLSPQSAVNHETHSVSGESQPTLAPAPASYYLLFEEPELFLHPKAQHVLFDALRVFAKEHHVLVTTHSPMFLGPGATETFVKLRKVNDSAVAPKPFTLVQPVNLSDMASKDQFQIICFENNNAAFFADTVVLVEGDSDYLLMPHIAKSLNPRWDVATAPVLFARITGKGNIRRYREFFAHFGVRVPVIADLDLLLTGFDLITSDSTLKASREKLLARVDALKVPSQDGPSAEEAKSAQTSADLRSLWRRVNQFRQKLIDNQCTQQEHDQVVEDFFAWQRKGDRLSVLKNSTDTKMIQLKHELLNILRYTDVFVLERGAIEEYYPSTVTGPDKPSRAQEFCRITNTREKILACCGEQVIEKDGKSFSVKEFDIIFSSIFKG
jgi:putative ATP-dependent endonuclease of the OLD family